MHSFKALVPYKVLEPKIMWHYCSSHFKSLHGHHINIFGVRIFKSKRLGQPLMAWCSYQISLKS